MSFAADLPMMSDAHLRAAARRDNQLFAITLAASVSIHLAVVAVTPGIRHFDEQAAKPLEVVIVHPPIPEPVRPRAVPLPPPPVVKPRLRSRVETKRKPAPTPVRDRPILALPEPAPAAPSTFSVPQASVEPSPPAPPPVAAAPVVPAPAPPPREVPSTPPSFNAAYLRNAPPRYPLIARRNGMEGTTRLKVLVSKEGKPTQVQVDRSSGSSALDNAALEAVRSWQFVPARRGQEAIESWVLVPVVFKLESAG